MQRVAVYGTLRKGECRNHYLSECKFLGTTQTPLRYGFQLYSLGPFPCVSPRIKTTRDTPTPSVLVEVYELSEDSDILDTLDAIEGFPHFYNRMLIDIPEVGDCWIYFLERSDHDGVLIPSGDWLVP